MPTKDILMKVKADTKQAESGFKRLGASVLRLGAGLGLAFGVTKLIQFGKESVKLAGIQETAEKKLQIAYGKSTEGLKKYAAELQKQTAFGDEAIIEAQALIAAFTKDEEAIKKLTVATLDLAEAKGMTLVTAADLLSKTIGSSTNALSRYGIEVIGAVGSTDRLNSLVGNLNDKFGGQAAGALDTYAGKMKNISNELGDIQEEIGQELLPVVLDLAIAFKDTVLWIKGAVKSIQDFKVAYQEFVGLKHPNEGALTGEKNLTLEEFAKLLRKRLQDEANSLELVTTEIKKQKKEISFIVPLFTKYVDVLTKASQLGGSGATTGMPTTSKSALGILSSPKVLPDVEIMRSEFREFDVIANESARTLFNAFSDAWTNIFGEANSLFEQLAQNIGMGLADLFAQDVSSSIFGALIPGGGLLDGLFGSTQSNSSTLVQVGSQQIQRATEVAILNVQGQLEKRRVL